MAEDVRSIEVPRRMAKLPRNRKGYVVPWFVAWIDGEADFRIIRPDGVSTALRQHTCWLCGQPLGRYVAYVIGPMCAVNRTSAEPPSHRECAIYAARACPFLANPRRHRQDAKPKPADVLEPPGIMLSRNPGVALVWVTEKVKTFRAPNGMLFDIGEPTETLWFAHSREATRDEVMASIESGYPALFKLAEEEGERAIRQLDVQMAGAMELVPAS
jgi:hypothetical protein